MNTMKPVIGILLLGVVWQWSGCGDEYYELHLQAELPAHYDGASHSVIAHVQVDKDLNQLLTFAHVPQDQQCVPTTEKQVVTLAPMHTNSQVTSVVAWLHATPCDEFDDEALRAVVPQPGEPIGVLVDAVTSASETNQQGTILIDRLCCD